MANIDKFNDNRIKVFLFATGYTVVTTAILAGAGYYTDQLLGTFPVIFIIAIVIAYPLTQVILFKKAKKLAKKINKK